jgi:hypothetical protein
VLPSVSRVHIFHSSEKTSSFSLRVHLVVVAMPTSDDPHVRVLCRIAPSRRERSLAGPAAAFAVADEFADLHGDLQVAIDGKVPVQSLYVADPFTGCSAVTGCTAVLGASCSQRQAFDAIAAPLVARAVAQGANVAILAYGQTCSGKTHTMFGPEGGSTAHYRDERAAGIVPRVIDALFSMEATHGYDIAAVDMAFFELHNESAIDHVARCFNEATAPPPPPAASRSASREMSYLPSSKRTPSSSSAQQPQPLTVTYRPTERAKLLRSLQKARCTSASECRATLSRLAESRLTAETELNVTSSRSHVIIQLHLLRKDGQFNGTVTLVDLAGSESLKTATAPHADPARVHESRSINVSLLALKKVVHALRTRAPFVPYKDSTLTVVLEDCLESSMTALVACLSVDRRDTAETLATVKFASEASKLAFQAGRNSQAAVLRSTEIVAERNRREAAASMQDRHRQLRSTLPFAALAPATGLAGNTAKDAKSTQRRAASAGHHGRQRQSHLDASVAKGLDFSAVINDDDDDYGEQPSAGRHQQQQQLHGRHPAPTSAPLTNARGDEDDIETTRLDDSGSSSSSSSAASPREERQGSHGRNGAVAVTDQLRLVATLQAQVRGLSDENIRLRRDNAAAKEELKECRQGAKTLLSQCDRLANQFVAMKTELEESRRREADQEAIIDALRRNSRIDHLHQQQQMAKPPPVTFRVHQQPLAEARASPRAQASPRSASNRRRPLSPTSPNRGNSASDKKHHSAQPREAKYGASDLHNGGGGGGIGADCARPPRRELSEPRSPPGQRLLAPLSSLESILEQAGRSARYLSTQPPKSQPVLRQETVTDADVFASARVRV